MCCFGLPGTHLYQKSLKTQKMKIVICQINPIIGDFKYKIENKFLDMVQDFDKQGGVLGGFDQGRARF